MLIDDTAGKNRIGHARILVQFVLPIRASGIMNQPLLGMAKQAGGRRRVIGAAAQGSRRRPQLGAAEKAMRVGVLGLFALGAAVLLLPRASMAEKQAQIAERAELAWTILPTRYLHYNVQEQKQLPPPRTLKGDEKQVAPARVYVGFFGNEITPAGEFVKRIEPLILDEALLQLAMFMPQGKQKVGAVWQREWSFSRIREFQNFAMTSNYELKGREEYAATQCWVIGGKHTYKAPVPPPAGMGLRSLTVDSTAWFDAELGALRGVRFILHGTVSQPAIDDEVPARVNYYDWEIEWRLYKDFDAAEERILNGRVERAIALGVENLLQLRLPDGLWFHGNHTRGATALSLLALLMCDVPPDDKRMIGSFKALADQPTEIIYDVALSVMALEARYITVEERRSFISSEKPVQNKRTLSPEDRAEMERLVQWIVENQNEPNPFWNYSRGYNDNESRYDFSCTQYALLGLAAAQRCEIRVPSGVIRKLVDQVRESQCADGPKLRRVIDYQPSKDPQKKQGRATYSTRTVEARGWAYSSKPTWTKATDATNAYGSMTSSGITCLLVGVECSDSMAPEEFAKEFGGKAVQQTWEKAAQDAVEGGMAWMEYWFSVTRNPLYGRTWYYYYMYGLERVGMLTGVRYIGEHNWYYEGCCPLLALQQKDGSWGVTAQDTSFALLFLKKGTVPPRRKVFTGEK